MPNFEISTEIIRNKQEIISKMSDDQIAMMA
jgi:hypothetical protein